jgi:hypothetical protein
MARRRSDVADRPLPARPYRDTVVVYGIMAVVLVVIAGLTGGSLLRGFAAGAAFFLLATAWSWWKFRTRIRDRDARAALEATATKLGPDRPGEEPEPGSRRSASNGAVNGKGNERAGGKR